MSCELLKSVFGSPHELGYESSVYVDEFIVAQKFEECFDTALSPQYPCYRNGVLSYTQKNLYLYQHKK